VNRVPCSANFVDIRRPGIRVTVAFQITIAQIIRENENDIRLASGEGLSSHHQQKQGNPTGGKAHGNVLGSEVLRMCERHPICGG